MDRTGSGPDLTYRPSLSEPWVRAQDVLPGLTLPLTSRCELLRALGHGYGFIMCCSALLLNFPPGKTKGESLILSSSQVFHLRVMRNKQDNSHGAHSRMLPAQEMPTRCSRGTGHISQLHINPVTLFAQ